MKHIVVCMKQVIDPEAPLTLFQIDPVSKRAILPKATPPVMSPFDENALESALKIKDSQDATVTVISLGRKLTRAVVRSALAAGADQLVLLEDELFGDFNTSQTAQAISLAIRKLGPFDLVLCGIQASDTNAGQVGICIAGILGIPCITLARKVELLNDKLRIEKALPEGYEVIEVNAPAVVTASYEVGALREPGVEAFMSAAKKPVTSWNAQQIGLESDQKQSITLLNVFQLVNEGKCEILAGGNPEEKVEKLVGKLKEAKLI
jgi:electron transfer flavoprotein beta subunit